MIEVLVVDDHALVRAAVRRLLTDLSDIHIVGEAANGAEAIKLTRSLQPKVVLLDVSMPGLSILETVWRLARLEPRTRVLMLSAYHDPIFVMQTLKAGAIGYVTKGISLPKLEQAIRSVYRGQRYVTEEMAEYLATRYIEGKAPSILDGLSHREAEMVLMLGGGERIATIAGKLCISIKTAHHCRHRLLKKLGVRTDLQLAKLVCDSSLLEIYAQSDWPLHK